MKDSKPLIPEGSFVGTDDLAAVAVNWGVFVINASADGPFCIRALALDNPEAQGCLFFPCPTGKLALVSAFHIFPPLQVHFLVPLCSGQVVCGGSGALLSLLGPDMASARPVKIMGVDADLLAAAALGEGVLMAGTRSGPGAVLLRKMCEWAWWLAGSNGPSVAVFASMFQGAIRAVRDVWA